MEIECQSGAEASRAIREMNVRGGPAIAQVAAYALALTADRMRDAKPYVRLATMRGTANSLAHARTAPAALRSAVDRMLARMTAFGELTEDGPGMATALRAEADAIATEALMDHARLVEAGRAELVSLVTRAEDAVGSEPLTADPVSPAERPLGVLTLGSTGALSGGQIGTALGVAIAYHAAGRPIHVYVLESRPGLDGARLAGWELAQAGVLHTILADAAVGWLLSRGGIDAILVGAERIAADGAVLGALGTLGLALAGASAHVPVLVCAPGTAIDPAAEDLSDLPDETRPPIEVMRVRGVDISVPGTPWLDPVVDVTPPEVIDAFVTEAGVIRRPFAPALAELAASVAARAPDPGPQGRDALGGTGGGATIAIPGMTPPGVRAGRGRSVTTILHPGSRALGVAESTDRELLRTFLLRDRIFSAYALCDLDDREFARTRWGVATHSNAPVAVVLEYAGLSPQPVFVLGDARRHRRGAPPAHPAAGRVRGRAPGVAPCGRRGVPRGPRPADGPHVGGPVHLPAVPGRGPPALRRRRRATSTASTSSGSRRGSRPPPSRRASTTASTRAAGWSRPPGRTSSAAAPGSASSATS